MIGTIFNIAILRLWNNKQELLLALVVPIIFFTIFAIIFSRGIATGTRPIDLAVIDADQSKVAKQITHFLDGQEVLRIGENVFAPHPSLPTRVLAEKIIQDRNKEVVLYLPPRLQHDLQRGNPVTLQILNEGSNPVGAQIVGALLTQAVATATRQAQPPPRVPPHPAMPRQSQRGQAVDHVQLVSQTQQGSLAGDSFTIVREDVLAGDKSNPKIAMYAAGIAVMFLLFSATGAGGSLLEDYEAGTLDRILTSRIGLTQLLAGKWLYITFLGCLQLTVMFGWAAAVFRVELRDNLEGFAAMTLVTAAATASFALCLATLARSRAQLQGLSIVLILTMSALGGSMIPRYIMSENMQRWGLFTFNAWALDGYKKVFWHELPVAALQHELIVLGSMAIILAIVARFFADRWAAD